MVVAHVQPRKVLPDQPARIIAVDATACEYNQGKKFLHVLSRALAKYAPQRFPEYGQKQPSILVIPELRYENRFLVRTLGELDDLILPTTVDNVFELENLNESPKSLSDLLLLRPALRELSNRFDIILFGKAHPQIATAMSDVTLQFTLLDRHILKTQYYTGPQEESNAASVIIVPEYNYAMDSGIKHVHDLAKYKTSPLVIRPPVPFCAFLTPTTASPDPVHERALMQVVDTMMTGVVAKDNVFVMPKHQEEVFNGLKRETSRLSRAKSFSSVTRALSASILGLGALVVAASTTISPGLLAFLPGTEWVVSSAAILGGSGAFFWMSSVARHDARVMEETVAPQNPFRLSLEFNTPPPLALSASSPVQVAESALPAAPPTPVHTVNMVTVSTPTAPADSEHTFRWEQVIERYKRVVDSWIDYEVDILKVIEYPLMSDVTCVYTANFHRAMNNAQMYKPSDIPSTPVSKSPFFKAVQELEIAFITAEQHAKKSRWSSMDHEQKQSLKTSKNLVALALDEGASLHERQSAYKQARAKLEGIVFLPDRAIHQIEYTVRLEIEA